ncbi:MAG TPA: hypothetical protein VFL46_00815 [Phycicoccus sp.]|nr:hypothetical protein [Phycicoccus sp.]
MERATVGPSRAVTDTRGDGRALRVTWHPDDDVVVLSVWRGNVCAATARIAREDVPDVLGVLAAGLGADAGAQRTAG